MVYLCGGSISRAQELFSRALGVSLKSPGVSLKSLGVSLKSLGVSLKSLGVSLKSLLQERSQELKSSSHKLFFKEEEISTTRQVLNFSSIQILISHASFGKDREVAGIYGTCPHVF